MLNRKVNYFFLIFLLIIVKIFGIYLPEIIEEKSYDTIKMPTKLPNEYQQHHQPHGYHHNQQQQQQQEKEKQYRQLQQQQQQKQKQQLQQERLQHEDHNINHLSDVIEAIRSQKQQIYLIKQQQQQQLEQIQQEEFYKWQQQQQQQHLEEIQQQQQPEEEILVEKSYDHINSFINPNNDVSITTKPTTMNSSNATKSTTYSSPPTPPPPPPTTTTTNVASSSNINNNSSNTILYRHKRQLSDLFIVPNTKWCGKGNLANGTYNYLGGASLADKCCRRHDNCTVNIPAFSNRYDMFNYLPYTLSHCSCDRRFHTCLKIANDDDARTVGKLFFNMIQTNCFIIRHEKVCRERATDGSCQLEIVKQKAYLKRNKKF